MIFDFGQATRTSSKLIAHTVTAALKSIGYAEIGTTTRHGGMGSFSKLTATESTLLNWLHVNVTAADVTYCR